MNTSLSEASTADSLGSIPVLIKIHEGLLERAIAGSDYLQKAIEEAEEAMNSSMATTMPSTVASFSRRKLKPMRKFLPASRQCGLKETHYHIAPKIIARRIIELNSCRQELQEIDNLEGSDEDKAEKRAKIHGGRLVQELGAVLNVNERHELGGTDEQLVAGLDKAATGVERFMKRRSRLRTEGGKIC